MEEKNEEGEERRERIITYEDYDDTCPDCGRDKDECICNDKE
ncbi:MAG: hypothetical protein AB1643_02130 [Patescibacteria group bacterium]